MAFTEKASHQMVSDIIDLLGGVSPWFGVGGANIEDFIDSALYFRIPFILAKHEFGAACMADTYFRTLVKPTCLLTTSGPGALNALPGIAESFASGTALLALIGETPNNMQGLGSFQEASGLKDSFNMLELFKPISRYCTRISSLEDWPQILEKTRQSLFGSHLLPPGPVVLLIPKDIQKQAYDPYQYFKSIQQISLDLTSSQIGTIVIGEELVRSLQSVTETPYSLLLELANTFSVNLVLSAEAKAGLQTTHPSFKGVIGALGDFDSIETLKKSDWIGVLGNRMGVFDRFGWDENILSKIKWVWSSRNPWPELPNSNFTAICQSKQYEKLITFLIESLAVTGKANNHITGPRFTLQKNHATNSQIKEAVKTSNQEKTALPIDFSNLYPLLKPLLERENINIISDAGNACATVTQELKLGLNSSFTIALGMGAMGYSFGASIGAYYANKKPCLVLAGDGAFFMHGSEIHTASQYQMPITFILFNNHAHAMCITRDQIFCNRLNGPNMFKPVHLGSGLKHLYPEVKVWEAESDFALKNAVEEIQKCHQTSILVINLSPEELPPFLPFQGVKK